VVLETPARPIPGERAILGDAVMSVLRDSRLFVCLLSVRMRRRREGKRRRREEETAKLQLS
jgi:hypothetical protein